MNTSPKDEKTFSNFAVTATLGPRIQLSSGSILVSLDDVALTILRTFKSEPRHFSLTTITLGKLSEPAHSDHSFVTAEHTRYYFRCTKRRCNFSSQSLFVLTSASSSRRWRPAIVTKNRHQKYFTLTQSDTIHLAPTSTSYFVWFR